MNDFKTVTIVNGGRVPPRARDDVTVEFNRDSIGFRPEVLYQGGKCRYFGKFLIFTVDVEAHRLKLKQRSQSFKVPKVQN